MAVLIPVGVALGDVFHWVDDEGVMHFSQWAPEDTDAQVLKLPADASNPQGYDPQEDPYSILNQSERIHALWSDVQAVKKETREQRAEVATPSSDDRDHFDRGYRFLAFYPARFDDRGDFFRQRQQQRALDEFDRMAPRPAHSINSLLHGARIEAKQQAVRTVRRQPLSLESAPMR